MESEIRRTWKNEESIYTSRCLDDSSTCSGTGKSINPALFSNDMENNSLLNPARLIMGHSMGFRQELPAGYGYYLSRYTNHLSYAFLRIEMELDLNVINYGSTALLLKLMMIITP
jgi:hypothetical protein